MLLLLSICLVVGKVQPLGQRLSVAVFILAASSVVFDSTIVPALAMAWNHISPTALAGKNAGVILMAGAQLMKMLVFTVVR